MKKRELFKVEGDRITRLRRNCPKCGAGVFLAEHKDRLSCGKCGYTEFKGKQQKPPVEPQQPAATSSEQKPSVEQPASTPSEQKPAEEAAPSEETTS